MGASYFSSSFLFDILGADASGPGAGTIGVRRGMTHRARCATLAHLFTIYGVPPSVGFTVTLCGGGPVCTAQGGKTGSVRVVCPSGAEAWPEVHPGVMRGARAAAGCERRAAAAGWRVPAEPTVPRLNSQVRRLQ